MSDANPIKHQRSRCVPLLCEQWLGGKSLGADKSWGPHKKLRVLIDARMLVGRFSGVARVVTCLLRELVRTRDVEPVALLGASGGAESIADLDLETVRCDFDRSDRDRLQRRRWEERRLAECIRASRVDLYHATWNSGIPPACPVPAVLTIHDLIPWHEPVDSFSAFRQRRAYRRAVRDSARRACRITTVSEFTRADVLRTLKLPAQKVQTIPNGVETPDTQRMNVPRPEAPFVLYVGGCEPRKNVHLLFAALSAYWRRHAPDLELHLTGAANALTPDASSAFQRLTHPHLVRFLGHPSDEELHTKYLQATALLMLSRAEGFGLPVLEAMARGCPVIAAPAGALPEVGGDAARYIDPSDADQVATAVHQLRTDSTLREKAVRAGREQALRFSWSTSTRSMVELYERRAYPDRLF